MSIRKAAFFSFSARYIIFAIQLFSAIIVARILSPEEFGIYWLASAVVALAHTLRDFGTTNYIIQERDLNASRVRTAFTVTLSVAWSLGFVLWLSAPFVSQFYQEPRVQDVVRVLAFNFLLIPFGSTAVALLRRQMSFGKIAILSVVCALLHALTAITLALLGFGFMSLAWAALASTIANVIGALWFRPDGLSVGLALRERRRVLGFSLKSSGASIANELAVSAPDIVIARTLGFGASGIFGRAMGYMEIFERVIQDGVRGILLPYMSERLRGGLELRSKVERIVEHIVVLSAFALGFMALLATPLIEVLFGDQWLEAAPVAQVLALAVFLRSPNASLQAAILATGNVSPLLTLAALGAGGRFMLLLLLSPFGLVFSALAICIAEAFILVLSLRLASRLGVCRPAYWATVMLRSLLYSGLSLLPVLLGFILWPAARDQVGAVLQIAVSGLLASGIWFFILRQNRDPTYLEMAAGFQRLITRQRVVP